MLSSFFLLYRHLQKLIIISMTHLFSIYVQGKFYRSSSSAIFFFLAQINWKHHQASTKEMHQRQETARLVGILGVIFFFFPFWVEDKRGLT